MTLPALISHHVHVSEREQAHTWPDGQKDDGAWEDCVWCSLVEWLNDTLNVHVPDTLAYAEKLRDSAHMTPLGGTSFTNVVTALRAMGMAPADIHVVKGGKASLAALKPGMAAVVIGSTKGLKSGNSLRRWSPAFVGGHSVYLARLMDGRLWWCDPLAPAGAYNGQWTQSSFVQSFIDALPGGGMLLGTITTTPPVTNPPKEPAMPDLTAYLPGYVATFKKGTNVRATPDVSQPAVRQTKANEEVRIIGKVRGLAANGSTEWLVWFENGKYVYDHRSNAVSVVPGPAASPAYPDLSKELASEKAARATAEAALALAAPKAAKLDELNKVIVLR